MPIITRQALEDAISNAISVFTATAAGDESIHRAAELIGAEIELETVRLPGTPLPEDIEAYLLALLAVKSIAGSATNAHRLGVLRCLRAAEQELKRHRFATTGDRCLVRAAPGELDEWDVTDERNTQNDN